MAKKAKRNQQKVISREQALRRKHRTSFLLNDKERDAVSVYCKKYKIGNKSKFMREAVMRVVMEQFLDDYPTLFEKQDLDRLITD
jgi:thiamine monophosphate synthase